MEARRCSMTDGTKRTESGEREIRLASDTLKIDPVELERQLALVRAEMPEPEAYPDDAPTNPSLDRTKPPCSVCNGVNAERCMHCYGTGAEPAVTTDSDPPPSGA